MVNNGLRGRCKSGFQGLGAFSEASAMNACSGRLSTSSTYPHLSHLSTKRVHVTRDVRFSSLTDAHSLYFVSLLLAVFLWALWAPPSNLRPSGHGAIVWLMLCQDTRVKSWENCVCAHLR